MEKSKLTGILLLNIGTPDSPEVPDVRRYLREFLSDPRVIDIPAPLRWLLLNLIILPTRPKRSAHAYKQIWTDAGSPLLVYGQGLATKLNAHLGADNYRVRLAMHYGNPSLESALDDFDEAGIDNIVVVPLYPQYSAAASGSAAERVMSALMDRWVVPNIHIVPPFFDHPAFVEALTKQAKAHLDSFKPDHILMSYHGLPERHCSRTDTEGSHCLKTENCCDQLVKANRNCYRAQSFATTRSLIKSLELDATTVTTSFQSRLGRTPWIRPYTDETLKELGSKGGKLMVLEPSFVSDCLETLEEIAITGKQSFLESGGQGFQLVPCLNDHELWVQALATILADSCSWVKATSQAN